MWMTTVLAEQVAVLALLCGVAVARLPITTVTNATYGLKFAVPFGWTPEVKSTYQVVARGLEGGFETHVVVRAAPQNAVRDYFLNSGEAGDLHVHGGWWCASSRSWYVNPHVSVIACSEQMKTGHALVASIVAKKEWLRHAGGEMFLRSLVAKMHGFRGDDD